MSIYIKKNGEKQKLKMPASDIQILDLDGKFKSSNLEDALKEVGSGTETNMLRVEEKVDDSIIQLAKKTNEIDNNRTTKDKTTTGAINELNSGLGQVTTQLSESVQDISNLNSSKAGKTEVFSMSNMGQDVREAMTGGSVAVIDRDGVLTETVVDKQITVEKINFAEYDGQTQIFNGEYINNKVLGYDEVNKWLYVTNTSSGNIAYYCQIPIKNNSSIRIRARGINRCRIAIAFQKDITNGNVAQGSKIIVNNDTFKDYDVEFKTEEGMYLLLYLGINLEATPFLEVLQRDINSKINFSSNLNLSEKDLTFIKANPIKAITNNFTLVKDENGMRVYRKDNLTEKELEEKKYVTLFINVENNKNPLKIKFRGNKGLVLTSKDFSVDDFLGSKFATNSAIELDGSRSLTFAKGYTVLNDTSMINDYEYNYEYTEGVKTILIYISALSDDYYFNIDGFIDTDYSIMGNNVKIIANGVDDSAPLNGKNLTSKSVSKEALNFDINASNGVNIPFWEVPQQPDTWATTSSGKDLNINSEQFMDLFFNPYVGQIYEDGYKVTKRLLGKDQSDVYNIYEYVFEPKNYTRTIIITSGNHPYELPAHFGFGRFIHYIMNEPDVHQGIRYIRDNVRIITIPVLNPWGFSQSPKIYGNCNLVNINRNFDSNGRWAKFPVGQGNEWNYKGTAPFSEKETQILRDLYIKYKDIAEWVIDVHCGNNTDLCDSWIVGITKDNVLLPKLYNAINMLDERCRNVLKREPVNKIQLDMDSSIRSWYSLEQLNLPNLSVEYRPQRYGGSMNGTIDLTYYLMYLSNYVFQALSFSNDELRRNQILLNRKIDLLLNSLNKQ